MFMFSGGPADLYKVFYVDTSTGGSPMSVDTPDISMSLNNLSPGSTYKYWVVPYNQGAAGTKSNDFLATIPIRKKKIIRYL